MAEVRVYDSPLPSPRAELRLRGTMPALHAEWFAWFLRAATAACRVGFTSDGRARGDDVAVR